MLMGKNVSQRDENRVELSGLPEPPPGARLWVTHAGHLIGGSASSFVSPITNVTPHILLKGRGTVRTAYGEATVGPGDMFALSREISVTYFTDPAAPWEFYWMRVVGEDAEALLEACGFDRRCPWLAPADPKAVIASFRAIRDSLIERPARHPYRTVSHLYGMIDACRGAMAAEDVSGVQGGSDVKLVDEALVLIEAQLAHLDVNGLAALLRVDRTTLFRAFKAVRGESPLQALTAARIDRARELLRQGDCKFTTVARVIGYSSDKSFSRAFRQWVGVAPKAWQQESRSAHPRSTRARDSH
jgi:AraC-like DNA-binding protein